MTVQHVQTSHPIENTGDEVGESIGQRRWSARTGSCLSVLACNLLLYGDRMVCKEAV